MFFALFAPCVLLVLVLLQTERNGLVRGRRIIAAASTQSRGRLKSVFNMTHDQFKANNGKAAA